MNTRFSLAFAALTVFGLVAAHPAAAQVSTIALQNGIFASAGNSNDVYDFTSSLGPSDTITPYTYGNHTQGPNSGIYINGGSVYQLLGTTGAAGEVLTLNGLIGNFGGPPPATELEFTTAAPTPTDQFAAGSVLASETLTPPAGGDNVNFAPLTFTTTMANQSIYLVIGGPAEGAGQQSNYQNFSLTDTPAAVPEASTTVSFGLLLTLGMGAVMIAARKKKSAAAA